MHTFPTYNTLIMEVTGISKNNRSIFNYMYVFLFKQRIFKNTKTQKRNYVGVSQ